MLREVLPFYYETKLAQNKSALRQRAGANRIHWWALIRERTWQWKRIPKIVTKYFGERGSFAYDGIGKFVILQGFAWLWKSNIMDVVDFYESELPFAYVAVLNSSLFELLLDTACPRVQGGQFDLSPRFISGIRLPNLADDMRYPGEIIRELVNHGRSLSDGKKIDYSQLTELTARVYGIDQPTIAELGLA